jgi:Flp pilus assembly protein TadG
MSLIALRRRLRSSRGTAMIELALFLPLLVFLVMTSVPAVSTVISYVELNEVTEAGARYATAAHLDPENPGVYRFRPDAEAVETYMRRISDVTLDSVTVSPDPATAFPGTQITVTVTHHVSFGPVGRAANLLAGLVHADHPFPEGGVVITSTATMREE